MAKKAKKLDFGAAQAKEIKESCLKNLARLKTDMDNLSNDRLDYFDAYMRQPYGNEVSGRSQFIASDVFETIETIMPTLMRVFLGGPDVVSVKPRRYRGPQDVVAAKNLEEKDNFDFQRMNDGYNMLQDFIKDCLLYKVSAAKTWWHKEKKEIFREFGNIDGLQLDALISKPDFVLDSLENAVTGEPIEDMQVLADPALRATFYEVVPKFNVKGREVFQYSYSRSEAVPPEEFIFDLYAKDPRRMFCAHKKLMPKKVISKKYGIPLDEIEDAISTWQSDKEVQQRYADIANLSFIQPQKDDKSGYIYECYDIYTDEDGNDMPYIVTVLGERVISGPERNKAGRHPFSVMSPVRIPHRTIGLSIAELTTDIQKLHTSIIRYLMDSLYFQTNKRHAVNPYQIDVDMFINDNKPGGVVFTLFDTEPGRWIHDMTPNGVDADNYQMLEILKEIKENRTGIMNANPSPVPTQALYTSSGIDTILGKIEAKVELIARSIADGVKDMFQLRVDLNTQFYDEEAFIEVNGEWKQIKAADISGLFDVVVDVASATGSKGMEIQQLLQVLNTFGMMGKLAMAAGPIGMGALPYTPKNLYNVIKEIITLMGRKNYDQFVTEPIIQDWKQLAGGGGQPNGGLGAGNPAGPGGEGAMELGGGPAPVPGYGVAAGAGMG